MLTSVWIAALVYYLNIPRFVHPMSRELGYMGFNVNPHQ